MSEKVSCLKFLFLTYTDPKYFHNCQLLQRMAEWEESVQVTSDMCEKVKKQVTSLGVMGNDNHSVAKK